MKTIAKILIWIWLSVTFGYVGIIVFINLFVILPFNKKSYIPLLLLAFARFGQTGINKIGNLYQRLKGDTYKTNAKYDMDRALIEDMKANVYCGEMFNDLLLKKDAKNKFGIVGETISDNLGEAKRDIEMNETGNLLGKMLNFIDKEHLEKSIKNNKHN